MRPFLLLFTRRCRSRDSIGDDLEFRCIDFTNDRTNVVLNSREQHGTQTSATAASKTAAFLRQSTGPHTSHRSYATGT